MPNINKDALFAVTKKLQDEQQKMRSDIMQNKYKFKMLVKDQTAMKRQLAIIGKLLRELEREAKDGKASGGI